MFVFTLIVIMIMLYEVKLAKSSSEPTFLRTIPGLKAVEEAVGDLRKWVDQFFTFQELWI